MTDKKRAGVRYRLVMAVCKLLRHPTQDIPGLRGAIEVRCPCGTISMVMRRFPVTGEERP